MSVSSVEDSFCSAEDTSIHDEYDESKIIEKEELVQYILGKQWELHSTSPLFHFDAHQLRLYAQNLIIYLRSISIATLKQEFGFQVHILPFMSDSIFLFEVTETRDSMVYVQAHADDSKSCEDSKYSTKASFILYLPRENGTSMKWMAMESLQSMENQLLKSNTRKKREPQHITLMSGDEVLLAHCCGWLQQRFQCIIGQDIMRLSGAHLRYLSNLWFMASLQLMISKSHGPARSNPGPFLLKYYDPTRCSEMQSYTMAIPFAAAARVYANQQEKHEETLDLLGTIESLYFQQLPFDTEKFKLQELESDDGTISNRGFLSIQSYELIETILSALLAMLEAIPASRRLQPALRL